MFSSRTRRSSAIARAPFRAAAARPRFSASTISLGVARAAAGRRSGRSTDAIGAMSQAPRHSNSRMSTSSRSSPRFLDRVVDRLRVLRHARDARADVHVLAPHRLGVEHVVEGRDARQVGGRHPHDRRDLVDRLRRAPAVQPLRRAQRGQRRRVVVGVARHAAPRSRPQLVGHLDLGQVRDVVGAASLVTSAGSSQPRGTCRSPVDPAEDRVEHRDGRDQVGDQAALAHRLAAPAGSRRTGRACARARASTSRRRATKQPSSPRGDSIATYASPAGTRKPSVTSLK